MKLELESERLKLSPIQREDWPDFLTLHCDPVCMKYVGEFEELDIRKKFEEQICSWDKYSNDWLCLTIRETDTSEFVGFTGFQSNWRLNQSAEVGYLLSPLKFGMGFASESLRCVLEFAFFSCNFHRLTASVLVGNAASVRVLEKLNFVHEGTLRSHIKLNGSWRDDLKFGLLQSEFVGHNSQKRNR